MKRVEEGCVFLELLYQDFLSSLLFPSRRDRSFEFHTSITASQERVGPMANRGRY